MFGKISASWRIWALFLILLVAAAVGGLLLGSRLAGRNARKLPVDGQAPVYTLTNQLGQTVSSQQFAGKVQIVTTMDPYCTDYCPLIAMHLAGFEGLLKSAGLQNRVQLVSFNINPGHTGPSQMRAFLKEYGWDPHDLHWQYLTGDPKAIRAAVTQGFFIDYRQVSEASEQQEVKLAKANGTYQPQPEVANALAAKAKPSYDIIHNDTLEIVDPRGNIRKIYNQADVVPNSELFGVIKQLLKHKHKA